MQLIKEASDEKLRGGFYTPEPIAAFILKWAFNGNKELDILEPSCGDGVFLKEIQKKKYEYNSVTAIEFDVRCLIISALSSPPSILIAAAFVSW